MVMMWFYKLLINIRFYGSMIEIFDENKRGRKAHKYKEDFNNGSIQAGVY